MKVFETTHLIRFQDCDPFGHLNNSKFLDYFINAREDHLLTFYDFDPYTYTKETGHAWVVGGHQIAYFSPANMMEKVLVSSILLEWNKADILVELSMWNEQKTQLKALIWTRFIHVNLKEMKKAEHGEWLTTKFALEENRHLSGLNFEGRITELKSLKK